MERSFKRLGNNIKRQPSAQAWNTLERRLHPERNARVRLLNPVWLAAACLVVAILSVPYLIDNTKNQDITALHPSFTVEELSITDHSQEMESLRGLEQAYRKLNLK